MRYAVKVTGAVSNSTGKDLHIAVVYLLSFEKYKYQKDIVIASPTTTPCPEKKVPLNFLP